MNSSDATSPPLVSVIIVNYNCKKWLDRFFPSLRAQSIFDRAEFILVDNTSTDGSAEICQKEMASWSNGVFLATGGNYGFGGGSNRGATVARGKYLFFLNPDVWMEPDCLEQLVKTADTIPTGTASPLVLDYDSDDVQGRGGSGFDIFGSPTRLSDDDNLSQPFGVATFFFIRRDLFLKVGQFDEKFFLFNEEMDLSWRVWLSGESIYQIPARIHHQGASGVDRAVENRTSEKKRFYSNRNQLLTLLKNARCLLLGLVLTQLFLITIEAVAGALLARSFSFVRWALFKPIAECWHLRKHIATERRRIRGFRRRGDFWILRHFFRFDFARKDDVKRLIKSSGVKIDKA